MVDVKKLLAKMLTAIKTNTTNISTNTTNIAAVDRKLTRAPLIKTAIATVSSGSMSGGGWSGAKKISWTTPSGYTALPGNATSNSGYVILYNNSWQQGATSVTVNFHNVGSSATTATAYANVVFVRSDMLSTIS